MTIGFGEAILGCWSRAPHHRSQRLYRLKNLDVDSRQHRTREARGLRIRKWNCARTTLGTSTMSDVVWMMAAFVTPTGSRPHIRMRNRFRKPSFAAVAQMLLEACRICNTGKERLRPAARKRDFGERSMGPKNFDISEGRLRLQDHNRLHPAPRGTRPPPKRTIGAGVSPLDILEKNWL